MRTPKEWDEFCESLKPKPNVAAELLFILFAVAVIYVHLLALKEIIL